MLKAKLKVWNNEVFGRIDLNINHLISEMNDLDQVILEGGALEDVAKLKEVSSSFWKEIHIKESIIKQKSRSNWIREGDLNTKFFHACIKNRSRANQIVSLNREGRRLEEVEEVKQEVKRFFEASYVEQILERPILSGIEFDKISEEEYNHLIAPFTEDEVKEEVWNCDGNKSPGPDGFNLNFIKNCWEVLKEDVMGFFEEFHVNAVLPKAISASFLALIPKKENPQDLRDYRPICLIGSIYKILTKVLASRLKKVLTRIISPCQSAFLSGRQILDGVLVVNELVDLAKRRKEECMLFKVDFEKAYDSVSWGFLEYMLGRMGFGAVWINWIRSCLHNSSMSVLVNGSPTEDFQIHRGLKQGDPLSPFLFLIVAEGLTGMVQKAVRDGLFSEFKVNNNLSFSLLQFADDTILVGKGSWDNLWSIKSIFRACPGSEGEFP